jgi:1,4-alpha-glucan branching enzyme
VLGQFTFVLHSHLPYVLHHGKWPFGSDWLCEAAAECYIPLLGLLDRLTEQNARVRISMDFSPILLEQLADPDFQEIFSDYCNERIELAKKDIEYFNHTKELEYLPLAEYWIEYYSSALRAFKNWYDCDLNAAFKRHSDAGRLDAMTCAATHGYLPLLLDDANVRAQIRLAIATHQKYFGKKPRGIWLPECAYRPRYNWTPPVDSERFSTYKTERAGIEEILSELGIEYFIVEGTLTKGGATMGTYNHIFADRHHFIRHDEEWKQFQLRHEIHSDRSLAEVYGVKSTFRKLKGIQPVVFSRDRVTAEQVWSAENGYPGDPQYLEFHKKHHNSGLRYWRISDSKTLEDKELYDPAATDGRLNAHADHFISLIYKNLKRHLLQTGTEGIVCSPFDTELFGHWWFEGPAFIEKIIEKLQTNPDITLTNCADSIDDRKRPYEVIALPEGSWGEGGGHYVWLNQKVAWMWEEIYALEDRFLQDIKSYHSQSASAFLTKVLKQAARELLLLESSDWQFLITTSSAADYSERRFKKHGKRLAKLLDIVEKLLAGKKAKPKEKDYLKKVLKTDHSFDEIDLNAWN